MHGVRSSFPAVYSIFHIAGAPIANGESPGTSSCFIVPLSIGHSLGRKRKRAISIANTKVGTRETALFVGFNMPNLTTVGTFSLSSRIFGHRNNDRGWGTRRIFYVAIS